MKILNIICLFTLYGYNPCSKIDSAMFISLSEVVCCFDADKSVCKDVIE